MFVAVRQQLGRFRPVLADPLLGVNQRVSHALAPCRAHAEIAFVHHDHAAGVVLPDIAGKAQDPPDMACFG